MTQLISVVITSYNYERFIAEAIDSVLSQDHPATELIVVDDGSTDGSRATIATYGDRLTAILCNVNRGHGHAFNRGFAAARGEIVVFLDADDVLAPGALTALAAQFRPEQTMFHARMTLVAEDGQPFDIFPKREQRLQAGDLRDALLARGRIDTTVASGQAWRRGFLQQVMPMPEEAFRQGADGYLATLAGLYGPVGAGQDMILANYRRHGQNHSAFAQVMADRAAWCIAHDRARYAALRDHAARLGLHPVEPLGLADLLHLEQLMVDRLHRGTGPLSRFGLAWHGIKAQRRSGSSAANTVVLTLWWTALAILPPPFARRLAAWKLQAASRPVLLRRLMRRLRRI